MACKSRGWRANLSDQRRMNTRHVVRAAHTPRGAKAGSRSEIWAIWLTRLVSEATAYAIVTLAYSVCGS